MHRVEQRQLKSAENVTSKPKIEIISSNDDIKVPDYRIFKKLSDNNKIYVQVLLKNVVRIILM